MPTQVVNPSVSLAVTPHGTALTVRVETPSGATMFNPGPCTDCGGNGAAADGVGDGGGPAGG